ADGDGQISAAERDKHFQQLASQLAERLELRTPAGQRLRAQFDSYTLGNSLTQTFRFTIATTAEPIQLDDGDFPHQPGQIRIATASSVNAESAQPLDLSHADWLSLKISRIP